jgi:hypothetical protein
MSEPPFLPQLPDDFAATRATLHAYAQGVGAIARAYAEAHQGLATDPVPLPNGETLKLRMDLSSHDVVVTTSSGDLHTVSMTAGLTGTEFAERLIVIAGRYGLEGEYHRERFESDEDRLYDPEAAALFFTVLYDVAGAFESRRATLTGEVSPVQLWPHGFDLAFEWFGTRVETLEEDGKIAAYPSQLNLGFYPAGRAYFYSNPWPFEADRLLDKPLPHGGEWHTEGWQGSILYYDQLQGDHDAKKKLLEYAAAVFEAVAPTLTA